ncbi:MAG: hypothetical protein HUJ61_07105, partial [Bacilli bacterium]|nr:hypothetical protein [Bacilli bacterium]
YSITVNKTDDHYADIEEIYEWFIKHDEVPEEYYLNKAKEHNIDINREKKYWMADLKVYSDRLEEKLAEFKTNEKEIEEGLIELEELKKKLLNGEKEYKVHKYEIIGGDDEQSIRDNIEYWKEQIDYEEYLKKRDKTLTKELLTDLDVLSLEEIKHKYFEMEVVEND